MIGELTVDGTLQGSYNETVRWGVALIFVSHGIYCTTSILGRGAVLISYRAFA